MVRAVAAADQAVMGPGRHDDADPSRLLVVSGDLSGSSTAARRGRRLVESLQAQAQHSQVSVRLTERPKAPQLVEDWRQRGIEVAVAPLTRRSVPGEDWGSYALVVVTQSGAGAGAMSWVDAEQPQAGRVLFLPNLPFHDVMAMANCLPTDELAGLSWARALVEETTRSQARWADAVWCEDHRDAAFLAAVEPGTAVALVPPSVTAGPPLPRPQRSGIVVVATEGHDVLAGAEDAAVRALGDILPRVRGAGSAAQCTVISDWPTPMLEASAAAAGALIVPSDAIDTVLSSARLVLAVPDHGRGSRAAVLGCLAAGTPLVATPNAIAGLDLGPAAPSVICHDDHDMATRARQLLADDEAWDLSAKVLRSAAELYSPVRRAAAMQQALGPFGIGAVTPAAGPAGWPQRASARKPVAVSHRPDGIEIRPEAADAVPMSDPERYRRWSQRHGLTEAARAALARDLDGDTAGSRISVLVPAGSENELLAQTLASVRDQMYRQWQLVLGRPGAPGPIPEELAGDPSVVVVDIAAGVTESEALNRLLAHADGEYVVWLPTGVRLKPHALAQVARWLRADPDLDLVYADDERILPGDGAGPVVWPKPDWSPDELMARNYIGDVVFVRRRLLDRIGGFTAGSTYDLLLRIAEHSDRAGHVPEPLYALAPSDPGRAVEAGPLLDALDRRGLQADVEPLVGLDAHRVRYRIVGDPRVVIIIPTRDRVDLLRTCIDSVVERSTYTNYEIVVVDNESTDPQTLGYLATSPWTVIRYPHRFNYARMVNLAARLVSGDALLFLNNDTEVIAPGWIEALLEHAMRPEVGAVGPRLYWRDGRPQHEGIIIGAWGDWATNLDHAGFQDRGDIVRNTSAVTGACTMIRPGVYWEVGGADERLRVAYNDVDLCLRIRQAGYQIVYTPYASLYHEEGSSRRGWQYDEDGPLFGTRWHPMELIDPYYGPVLSDVERFRIRV